MLLFETEIPSTKVHTNIDNGSGYRCHWKGRGVIQWVEISNLTASCNLTLPTGPLNAFKYRQAFETDAASLQH